MIHYYCKRCQRPSTQQVCDTCQKAIPQSSICNVWEHTYAPIQDGNRVFFVLRMALYVCLLVFFFLLVLEVIFSPQALPALQSFFATGGILPTMVQLYLGLAAVGLFVLAMQGTETEQYLMEPAGILKRTWIRPTRVKCFFRMIPYREESIRVNQDQVRFLMADESYLAWQDVERFLIVPKRRMIKLYRPQAFLFMYLNLPPEDFLQASDMVTAKLKKLMK